MTTYKSLKKSAFAIGIATILLLGGCASQTGNAPIEGIGPEGSYGSNGNGTEISALGQGRALDSHDIQALQSQIYNADSYTPEQQRQMMLALNNASCRVIHFAFNSDQLSDESKQCLNQVANYLTKYNQPIRIAGHTDPRGSEKYNLNLGQRRADSIRQYLLQQGVTRDLACSISYGKSKPAASPSTLYNQFCGADVNAQCQAKAQSRAYYLDRRAELEFGKMCG